MVVHAHNSLFHRLLFFEDPGREDDEDFAILHLLDFPTGVIPFGHIVVIPSATKLVDLIFMLYHVHFQGNYAYSSNAGYPFKN